MTMSIHANDNGTVSVWVGAERTIETRSFTDDDALIRWAEKRFEDSGCTDLQVSAD